MSSSAHHRLSLPLPRTPLPDGVYRQTEEYAGEPIFITVRSGYVLEQLRPRLDETPEMLLVKSARLFRVTAPSARPPLALVPEDVTAYVPRSSAARSWLLAPPPRLRVPRWPQL